eukprot:7411656-Heterocapsa_arctica.AAC.1
MINGIFGGTKLALSANAMPVIDVGGASGSADSAPPQADAPPPAPHPGEAVVYLTSMHRALGKV